MTKEQVLNAEGFPQLVISLSQLQTYDKLLIELVGSMQELLIKIFVLKLRLKEFDHSNFFAGI